MRVIQYSRDSGLDSRGRGVLDAFAGMTRNYPITSATRPIALRSISSRIAFA